MPKAKQSSTDAGGVAARQGFKYQDHAAVQFVLEMIDGPVIEVQCETSDDIEVTYQTTTLTYTEYIQVKVTEGDLKWKVTEFCKSDGKGSIYTKSFAFDNGSTDVCFRIITKRDVEKKLSYLTIGKDERSDPASRDKLIKAIKNASQKYKSPVGREADYWVDNALWQVSGSAENLAAVNQKKLLQIASNYGWAIPHAELEQIYKELLEMVDDAATASNKTQKDKKIISKSSIMIWWKSKQEDGKKNATYYKKPYNDISDAFLIEFHSISEEAIKRSLTGLEAGFDNKKWRSKELAEHLLEWLPEIALKASVLANINHTNFRVATKKAIQAIQRERKVKGEILISEILLHIGIRQVYHSEPIACKIFYLSDEGTKYFANAHIVRIRGKEELWLGKSTITYLEDYETCINNILSNLEDHLDTHFLKDEREVILDLKETQHLKPNQLERILYKHAPVDVLIEHLCIPILIAYNSNTLAGGFFDRYKEKLVEEIEVYYQQIKDKLSGSIAKIKIHIFFLPFDDCKKLVEEFDKILNT